MSDDEPLPRLEVGKESWNTIFGEQGDLKKVHVIYASEEIWGYIPDQFTFEIKLWNRKGGCDWDLTRTRLPHWEKTLNNKGLELLALLRGNKKPPENGKIGSYNFTEAPKEIAAGKSDVASQTISKNQIETMSSEILVDALYKQILNHCADVEALRA